MMSRTRSFLVLFLGSAALVVGGPAGGAQPPADYSANLAALYGEQQWVLAVRDACVREQPKAKAAIEDAVSFWRERHREILDDLEARFAALVKQASRDQKEYTRNYAKYQSEVLKQRQEERQELLAMPKPDLQRLCADFPGYLRDARSEIPNRLPDEFAAIYRKK